MIDDDEETDYGDIEADMDRETYYGDTGYGESTTDLDTIIDDKETTWDEDKQPNINKPYDKLKQYNNLNKDSEEFANIWLQISKEDLNFKENK